MGAPPHGPSGLRPPQLAQLEEHVGHGHLASPEHLLQAAYAHLEDIQGWHTQDPSVDVKLAQAITHVLDRVVSEWDTFSPVEQSWLRGMIRYFAQCNDRYHDFQNGGLRDDLEVVNACLRFVNRPDLLLPGDDDPSELT